MVLHRAKLLASNQSVLALSVAPSRVRAAAPHSARHGCRACMPKGFARTQSQPSIHSPSPRGRGLGIRQGCRDRTPKGFARTQSLWAFLKGLENLLYFYKYRLFLQTARPPERRSCCFVLLVGLGFILAVVMQHSCSFMRFLFNVHLRVGFVYIIVYMEL